jgi:hypothetical protein
MRPLEDRFPRPGGLPGRGRRRGGARAAGPTSTSPPGGACRPSPTLAERYMALLELARHYPPAVPVIFTGGIGRLEGGVPPETETVRLLLARHGLDGAGAAGGQGPDHARERPLRKSSRPEARRAVAPRHLGRPHAALGRRVPRRRLGGDALAGRLSAPAAGPSWASSCGSPTASTNSTRPPTSGSASPTTARWAGRRSCSRAAHVQRPSGVVRVGWLGARRLTGAAGDQGEDERDAQRRDGQAT